MDNLERLWQDLEGMFPGRGRCNEPLAAHTTLRLGGPADIWFPARSVDELAWLAGQAQIHQVKLFMLGGGANLLISDNGIRGLVVENRANAVQFLSERVVVESGVVIPRLTKQCAQRGLSGLEWAVGIPGTIGGAVVNNAGAYGHSIAEQLIQAELLDQDGNRIWRPAEWFEYRYRHSRLKQTQGGRLIVLQAELALTPTPKAEIEARMQAFNERRKATQPPGATIGSMFKNPPGDYAGRLIEAVGLKGYRLNQAQISPIHANFFINLGHAKAGDVMALIEIARERVAEQFGIPLELEIEIV